VNSLRPLALGISLTALALAMPLGCASDQHTGSAEVKTDAGKQLTFATPQAAVDALIDGSRRDDREYIRRIFGPDLKRMESGDSRQDKVDLQRFVATYDLSHFLYDNGDNSYTLVMGLQQWEFPAPIVAIDDRWRFDTIAGVDELITRTNGMNELHVIDAAAAFVAAEEAFHAMDPNGDKVPEYAATFRSSTGNRDGLYWPDVPGEPISPLGPLIAQAVATGDLKEDVEGRQPYRGYYYRILTKQGAGAPGGAMDYIDGTGRMTKGFALLAWPASYDETGVMSFIVSMDGTIHQRDLGEQTSVAVESITAYDPQDWAAVSVD
jgi:hypothetical protein